MSENTEKKKGPKGCLVVIIFLVIIVAIIAAVSGGEDDEKNKGAVGDSSSVSDNSSSDTTKEVTAGIGEFIENKDIKISLLGVKTSKGTEFIEPSEGNIFVTAEFEIENNSDETIIISSLLLFDTYFDDYSTDISFLAETLDNNVQTLDGEVAAGKKLKGVIGWEVSTDWKVLEVSVKPDFWSSDSEKFHFVVNREEIN